MTVKYKPKIFCFKEQLRVGDAGEDLILKKYPKQLFKIDAHFADFIDSDGLIYELKTDTYPLTTGNYFIERWSDTEKEKPGGPWQALTKGVDVWLYLYLNDMVLFRIDNLTELITYLEMEIIPKIHPTKVYNRGYYGTGYKVNRELLSKFATEILLK